MAFYDFPAKHWQSIRTSNPIKSTFGTLHMMFKLGQCVQKNGTANAALTTWKKSLLE